MGDDAMTTLALSGADNTGKTKQLGDSHAGSVRPPRRAGRWTHTTPVGRRSRRTT